VALLAALAMGSRSPRAPRLVLLRQWAPVAASALVLAQLGTLAEGFRLSQALPPNADRVAGQRLAAAARALGGTVAIPADPSIAVAAGLPPAEDQVAAADVLRASDERAKTIFTASLAQAVAAKEFSAIITEYHGDLRGFPADLPRYYRRCPQAPHDGLLSVPLPPNAMPPPVSVWLPVGRGSCTAVARALGDTSRGQSGGSE
jgi:hypothetical protein